eukprot:2695298-Rhodomonas_salina.2
MSSTGGCETASVRCAMRTSRRVLAVFVLRWCGLVRTLCALVLRERVRARDVRYWECICGTESAYAVLREHTWY